VGGTDTNVQAAPVEGVGDDVVADANVQAASIDGIGDDTVPELVAVGKLP
jgi:hypothetical protein